MNVCIRCERPESPEVKFTKDKTRPSGYHPYCKDCRTGYWKSWAKKNSGRMVAANKRWRASNPGYSRSNNLRWNYGISPLEYDTLLASQNARCAVCETDKPNGRGDNFHVDHDHVTDNIRGLLCSNCNTGTGLTDSPDLLIKKAVYLLSHGSILEDRTLVQKLNDNLK